MFAAKCNQDSVALESVVDKSDLQWLQDTLKEFADRTGSQVAFGLLAEWPEAANKFVKVVDHFLSISMKEISIAASDRDEISLPFFLKKQKS